MVFLRIVPLFIVGELLGTPYKKIGDDKTIYSPAISLSGKERARMVFKSEDLAYLPVGFYPLEGDSAEPPAALELARSVSTMAVLRKQRKITTAMKSYVKRLFASQQQNGHAVIVTGSELECIDYGRKLLELLNNSAGTILSVMPLRTLTSDHYESYIEIKNISKKLWKIEPEVVRADKAKIITNRNNDLNTGHLVQCFISELISFYRSLMTTSQWSGTLRTEIRNLLENAGLGDNCDYVSRVLTCDAKMNDYQVLGILMVLGGFNEPLRTGGFAHILSSEVNENSESKNVGLVLQVKVSSSFGFLF